ncbi:MAG: hypothetical protein MJA82_04350 [Clostridia bacterium]|nr:hypothetical protein [Clostridia bacterium]
MKKNLIRLNIGVCIVVLMLICTVYAYNYKFSFDMNTGVFHGAAYSGVAYKYTKAEPPVLRVDNVESKVRMNFVVVNSDGASRTGVVTTRSKGNWVFPNDSTAQNYQYRLKAWTDDGNFYNRYNVTGAWNPDSY